MSSKELRRVEVLARVESGEFGAGECGGVVEDPLSPGEASVEILQAGGYRRTEAPQCGGPSQYTNRRLVAVGTVGTVLHIETECSRGLQATIL